MSATAVASSLLEGAVRTATPLALAALGEVIVERTGVINIGLEGIVLSGAFGAVLGSATGHVALGFLSGAVAGVALAAVFALFAVTLRADQIIAGVALNLLAFGATGALYRALYGTTGVALTIPTTGTLRVPLAAGMPLIGPAFFDQPPATYALYLLVPLLAWWLHRTHSGLAARAVGEDLEAAYVAGVRASRVRWVALLVGGLFGGASGATLVLSQAGTFAEGMSAGRGFIAIAIVVLGRWDPIGVAIASLLFGAAMAVQYTFQAMGSAAPYQLFLALPYIATLLALAGFAGRARAPAGLGRS